MAEGSREYLVDVLELAFSRLETFVDVLSDYVDRYHGQKEPMHQANRKVFSNLWVMCDSLVHRGRQELDSALDALQKDLGDITLARTADGKAWTDARIKDSPEK